jgi:HlyD family secretion protein
MLIWGAAGIALLAAGGLWWRQAHAPATLHYVTARLDRGPVVRAVTASGTVNPVLTVIVGSYVSGVVRDIGCDFNTVVHKGQVCATIDPRPYELAVDESRAALATAKAQLLKDQASLSYAQANEARNAKLVAGGWLAPDTGDNLRAIRDEAAAQLAVDRATVQQRQAALDAAEVNLGYTRIVSPVDGVVVSRNVTQGQTVAASFQTPTLFLIAQDLTKMQVDTNVSESDVESEIRGIRAGDAATFTVEAFPDRPFQGVVSQVRQAPQTVQNVVTYDVVIAVDNPQQTLKPGMTATVRILTDRREDVLRAPNAALRFSPGGLSGQAGATRLDRLWVLKDAKPSPVAVGVGLEDDAYTEITRADGLKAGDAVITGQASGPGGPRPGGFQGGAGAAPRMPRL